MKKKLLIAIATICAVNLISKAEPRRLYVYAEGETNGKEYSTALPVTGNEVPFILETGDKTNIYEGIVSGYVPTGLGTQFNPTSIYFYSSLTSESSFDKNKTTVNFSETTNDKDFFQTKVNNGKQPCLKLSDSKKDRAYVAIHLDLNRNILVADRGEALWVIPASMEKQMTYSNFETVTPYRIEATSPYSFSKVDGKFFFARNLCSYNTIHYAPAKDSEWKFDDNGISDTGGTDVYMEYPGTEPGKWINSRTGETHKGIPGYWTLPASVKNDEIVVNLVYAPVNNISVPVFRLTDLDKMQQIYVDTRADKVFDWQNYTLPDASLKSAWATPSLKRVEGKKGVFRGSVEMPSYEEWQISGCYFFDRFPTAGNDDHASLAYSSNEITSGSTNDRGEHTGDLFTLVGSQIAGQGRVNCYPPAIGPVEFTVDLINNTMSAKVAPETFPYTPPEDERGKILWLVGSPQNWNIQLTEDLTWALGMNADGAFERTFRLPAGENSFRFFTQLGSWSNEHSIGSAYDDFYVLPISLPYSGSAVIKGLGNWGIDLTEDTYVKMVVNINDQSVSFTRVEGIDPAEPKPELGDVKQYAPESDVLGSVAGSAKLQLDKSTLSYIGRINIPAGAQTVRFKADKPMGADYEGRPILENGEEKTARRIIFGSEDCWRTPANWKGGEVDVTIAIKSATVTFTPVVKPVIEPPYPENMEVIGQFNSWVNEGTITLPRIADGVFVGPVKFDTNPGEFKVRTIGSWSVNFGAYSDADVMMSPDNAPHMLSTDGANFSFSDDYTGGLIYILVHLPKGFIAAGDESLLSDVENIYTDTDSSLTRYYDLQGRSIPEPRKGETTIMVTPHGAKKIIR